jgi:hypothetical protein
MAELVFERTASVEEGYLLQNLVRTARAFPTSLFEMTVVLGWYMSQVSGRPDDCRSGRDMNFLLLG